MKTSAQIESFISKDHICYCSCCYNFQQELKSQYEISLNDANLFISEYSGGICKDLEYFLYEDFVDILEKVKTDLIFGNEK